MSREKYLELVKTISDYDYRYYVLAEPIIGDEEYDALYRRLLEIEQSHPEWIVPESPSRRIGGEPSGDFPTVIHERPMMSLANTYSMGEVRDFDRRIRQLLPDEEITYSCEPKIDGIAVTLHYRNGEFKLGATRGDGYRGDDITTNLRTIRSIPLKISQEGENYHDFEVRGEVYMPLRQFHRINEERVRQDLPPFANPRNATAGSMKTLDPREVSRRGLMIWCYDLDSDENWIGDTHDKRLKQLEEMRFPVVHPRKLVHRVEEVEEYYHTLGELRSSLPYEIDGVVVKVNDLRQRDLLGATAKSPRWAMAYKFAASRAETVLRSITHQVGRTGAVTPVGELEPVFLAGSTIKRVTLHNYDEIKRLGIGENTRVILEKAGDVIPKVVSRAPGEPEKEYQPPRKCPVCGQPLVRSEDEVIPRCVNFACPAMILGRIEHFVSRGAMDIEGLGSQTVDLLIQKKMVKDAGDLYFLDFNLISQLPGFGKKSADKLKKNIEESKNRPLDRVLFALGIRFVGAGVARVLAENFSSIDELEIASNSPGKLEKIEEIGPRIAASIAEFFANPGNQQVLEKLRKAGVTFSRVEQDTPADQTQHPWYGKRFVLTGTLKSMSRGVAGERLRAIGAIVSSSLSSKTDYLVVGESPGSKLKKAKDLRVTILSENEFLEGLEITY